ncbi:putative succinate-semialdehyde dehydrogenase (NAD(+)) [Helianthus annuus]|uniref:Succinate-semialdehyde dehydrogenase n=1 Tax=Helianthus annuus TaxID=4232 RepID=A0A251UAZ0_HELAN|nr:succinate-semialdehyde dehydrogenase, mitochondrial isoform X1 [Helianthus annuus]KAF5803425.1 putative succinate-semialdehyde dehydrogenase (NAD(+)) [Helianthus annuus]KAJ0561383.1 putative succinate-semialdehyde dehydrogenase (NAD(+)) [Helianthus annuus]KAJ0568003.1 putative succinate-semialdehyde dehydrogenase (NAD(+)) [Helianthus annuus]KAJ0574436.1 putative succinate-semialdehyde dehydrogenase (NAD(+)) [Helianthus annuus]KAJ0738772.1 putative succinate-semialdehyde dehydrogenase (NAD(+
MVEFTHVINNLKLSSNLWPQRPFLSIEMSMQTLSVVGRLRNCGLLKTRGLIGGKWTDAYDGRTIQVNNPADGEVIATVPCMGEMETKDAISAAYDAFTHWSKLTAADRSSRLRNWYNLLIAHKQEIGQLLTLEQGKPLREAIAEVAYAARFIELFAEEAKRVYGDIIPSPLPNRRLFVLKEPVGVVGAITPWNFPIAMIARKVGPALACGCTVVIKPSELTPLTALAAAELALQSGIPPGVLNVVMGDPPSIGDSLLESTQVRKITFTGSTGVGKKLMAGASETVKKVSLELGGNAPCIIFDDADLELAVKGSLSTKFNNTGQQCVCTNRILVQEGIYDRFINAYSNAVQNLKVGNGLSEGVTQGPLINEAAVMKVDSLVQDAISKGAKVIMGGKRHSLGFSFYEPTIIGDVRNEMPIAREEVFGPVAPIIRFKTEEEAIQIANDTNSGLAAYAFTNCIQRSWRVSEALEYGMVGVNEGSISTEVAPFGGYKQSGLGREGSKYGLDDYLEIKYVCMGNM